MKRRILMLLMIGVLIFSLLAGCSANVGEPNINGGMSGGSYDSNESLNGALGESNSNNGVLTDRKLIRRISVSAETEDMDVLLSEVTARVSQLNGYIESRNIQNGSNYGYGYRSRSATLVIRIPAEHLDSFLQQVSDRFVLDISHMGIVGAMIESMGVSADAGDSILQALREKNTHGVRAACAENGVEEVRCDKLLQLMKLYGPICEILPALDLLCADWDVAEALHELHAIADVLQMNGLAKNVRLDFSVVHDIHYYSGIVFEGFVDGIPSSILIGGRYDRLLRKMGKQGGAVGFAVYLDLLERLHREVRACDADILCLYDENTDPSELSRAVLAWNEQGKSVLLQKEIPAQMRFGEIIRFACGGEDK